MKNIDENFIFGVIRQNEYKLFENRILKTQIIRQKSLRIWVFLVLKDKKIL